MNIININYLVEEEEEGERKWTKSVGGKKRFGGKKVSRISFFVASSRQRGIIVLRSRFVTLIGT